MLIAGVPSDKKKGGTPGVGSVHLIFGGFPGFLEFSWDTHGTLTYV